MKKLPIAESITHQHILSVINTLILNKKIDGPIRILDAGCGNGKLITYLHKCLHLLHKDKEFHISGYDVRDHGVQTTGFLNETIDRLTKDVPGINWAERIHTIQANDEWNFVTDKYTFIVSNQVLEHVHNKDLFFSNINFNLIDGGHSIHLAPLKHILHEGHIFIPWAHRIKNYTALYWYIRFMSSLGIGKYPQHKKETNCSVDEFSERHADYIYFWTAYSAESETLDAARRQNLRADFRFTSEFFTSKLRKIFGKSPNYVYKYREYGLFDALSVKVFRYVSSTTLLCRKINKY